MFENAGRLNPSNNRMLETTYTVWLRDIKKYARSKTRVFTTLFMPVFIFVVMGNAFGNIVKMPNYLDFLAPGILAMAVVMPSMFVGVSVLWDRQFGFMKEMLVAPVSRTAIVAGKVFAGATTSLFQGIVFITIMLFAGVHFQGAEGILAALLFMTMLSCAFVALGIALASKIKSMEAFQVLVSAIIMPLIYLSGTFFPLSAMPDWLRPIAYANPLTYSVDGLRGSLIGGQEFSIAFDFFIMLFVCAYIIHIATALFKTNQ